MSEIKSQNLEPQKLNPNDFQGTAEGLRAILKQFEAKQGNLTDADRKAIINSLENDSLVVTNILSWGKTEDAEKTVNTLTSREQKLLDLLNSVWPVEQQIAALKTLINSVEQKNTLLDKEFTVMSPAEAKQALVYTRDNYKKLSVTNFIGSFWSSTLNSLDGASEVHEAQKILSAKILGIDVSKIDAKWYGNNLLLWADEKWLKTIQLENFKEWGKFVYESKAEELKKDATVSKNYFHYLLDSGTEMAKLVREDVIDIDAFIQHTSWLWFSVEYLRTMKFDTFEKEVVANFTLEKEAPQIEEKMNPLSTSFIKNRVDNGWMKKLIGKIENTDAFLEFFEGKYGSDLTKHLTEKFDYFEIDLINYANVGIDGWRISKNTRLQKKYLEELAKIDKTQLQDNKRVIFLATSIKDIDKFITYLQRQGVQNGDLFDILKAKNPKKQEEKEASVVEHAPTTPEKEKSDVEYNMESKIQDVNKLENENIMQLFDNHQTYKLKLLNKEKIQSFAEYYRKNTGNKLDISYMNPNFHLDYFILANKNITVEAKSINLLDFSQLSKSENLRSILENVSNFDLTKEILLYISANETNFDIEKIARIIFNLRTKIDINRLINSIKHDKNFTSLWKIDTTKLSLSQIIQYLKMDRKEINEETNEEVEKTKTISDFFDFTKSSFKEGINPNDLWAEEQALITDYVFKNNDIDIFKASIDKEFYWDASKFTLSPNKTKEMSVALLEKDIRNIHFTSMEHKKSEEIIEVVFQKDTADIIANLQYIISSDTDSLFSIISKLKSKDITIPELWKENVYKMFAVLSKYKNQNIDEKYQEIYAKTMIDTLGYLNIANVKDYVSATSLLSEADREKMWATLQKLFKQLNSLEVSEIYKMIQESQKEKESQQEKESQGMKMISFLNKEKLTEFLAFYKSKEGKKVDIMYINPELYYDFLTNENITISAASKNLLNLPKITQREDFSSIMEHILSNESMTSNIFMELICAINPEEKVAKLIYDLRGNLNLPKAIETFGNYKYFRKLTKYQLDTEGKTLSTLTEEEIKQKMIVDENEIKNRDELIATIYDFETGVFKEGINPNTLGLKEQKAITEYLLDNQNTKAFTLFKSCIKESFYGINSDIVNNPNKTLDMSVYLLRHSLAFIYFVKPEHRTKKEVVDVLFEQDVTKENILRYLSYFISSDANEILYLLYNLTHKKGINLDTDVKDDSISAKIVIVLSAYTWSIEKKYESIYKKIMEKSKYHIEILWNLSAVGRLNITEKMKNNFIQSLEKWGYHKKFIRIIEESLATWKLNAALITEELLKNSDNEDDKKQLVKISVKLRDFKFKVEEKKYAPTLENYNLGNTQEAKKDFKIAWEEFKKEKKLEGKTLSPENEQKFFEEFRKKYLDKKEITNSEDRKKLKELLNLENLSDDRILIDLGDKEKHRQLRVYFDAQDKWLDLLYSDFSEKIESWEINLEKFSQNLANWIDPTTALAQATFTYREFPYKNWEPLLYDSKKWVVVVNGKRIQLSKNDKKLAEESSETLRSIVDFHATLNELWLLQLWSIKDNIFKGISSKKWESFKVDRDYLNENEMMIFLNSVLKSVGEPELSGRVFNLESMKNHIKVLNYTQATWWMKTNTLYGTTKIEEAFINKFTPRGSLMWFKMQEFQKAIKTNR